MSIAEKLVTIAENQQKVFDAGKDAECNTFWDVFQNYGNRTNYANAFYNTVWTDGIYKPKYPFKLVGSYGYVFANARMSNILYPVDVTEAIGVVALFAYNSLLETIPKIIVSENTTYQTWFSYCPKLTNVTFEGIIGKSIDFSAAVKLAKASIENIVSCLSTTATGQTFTLSKTAVNNAFTTDEWNALIADKTNWTISLV